MEYYSYQKRMEVYNCVLTTDHSMPSPSRIDTCYHSSTKFRINSEEQNGSPSLISAMHTIESESHQVKNGKPHSEPNMDIMNIQ